MKIGIFDSGIGGLTVAKSILNSKLFEEIIYYGDTARVPYGTKDKNTIISYSLEALEFFKNFDLDMIIIACNSVSAYALKELRENTNIPVVGVIDSGILALEDTTINKNDNILVLGTKATIESNLYLDGLKSKGFKNIVSKATPLFVPLVEEGILNGAILDETMDYYFKDISLVDVVILGCTHFPLLEDEISKYFNNVQTIHSGDAIVKFLKKEYHLKKLDKNIDTKISFFASSACDKLKEVAYKWLDIRNTI